MLSAIAARKAAQASKLNAALQPPPSSSKSEAPPEREPQPSSTHRVTVLQPKPRPSAAVNSHKFPARKKRRRKSPKAEVTQNRYYESPGNFIQNADYDESVSNSTSDSEEDPQEVHLFHSDLGNNIETRQPRKPNRSWSPSRPPHDSSDDELDMPAPSQQFPSSSAWTQDGISQSLTFSPLEEKNIFLSDGLEAGFLSGRKGTVVALSDGEAMALLGVYSLTVLRGGVSLMGTELRASTSRSYTIFAPKCSPIPIIRAIPSNGTNSCPLSDRILRAVDSDTTILYFEDVHTGVVSLGSICRTFEGVFETSSLGKGVLSLSAATLLTSISRSLQAFQLPESWKTAFASLLAISAENSESRAPAPDSLTLLVKGRKRTGKSTLARTLANRLVSQYRRVAYLECDLGQTEFTPPGLASLNIIDQPVLGPPFTHPRIPYASHFIGTSSPKDNPRHYLAAISALFQTYRLELQHPEYEPYDSGPEDSRIADLVPLVVNTMGWLKGLGADLSKQIEELVEPTHVFAMLPESTGMKEGPSGRVMGFPSSTTKQSTARTILFEVEAITSNPQLGRFAAADWRNLSLMSYFHSVPSPAQFELLPAKIQPQNLVSSAPQHSLCTWHCRLPLVAQVPFAVSPAEAIDDIILVGSGTEDIVPSEIGRVLNGAIVALVSRDAETPLHTSSELELPYSPGTPPPDPYTSNCIGLALIRGVSPSLLEPPQNQQSGPRGGIFHLLTPLPLAFISASSARSFVKGEIELPVWGMLDHRDFGRADLRARENGSVPHLQWNKSDAIGAGRRRVRRNIMRREQM